MLGLTRITGGSLMLLANHRIKESYLDLLCRGSSSPELTQALWRTEFSRRLLLVNSVLDLAVAQPELLGPLPHASTVVELLNEIDEADRDLLRDVLLHPPVGSWAAYVLRRSRGLVESAAPSWVDVGLLHSLAFVAAVRHGRSWATVIPARNGRAMLPGLGMAVFPHQEPWGLVVAETQDGAVSLRHHECEVRLSAIDLDPSGDGEWWELRRLQVGTEPALTVTFDDIDPFRDLGDPVEPQRLTVAETRRWESLLAHAWAILCTGHRASAEAMAEGIVTLVPLVGEGDETRSASTGEAFGSVLVSEPFDALSLAVALVHEFAHIQLGGLLHLLPVTAGGQEERFYAPWRDDPRPLPGLVQGIYAFVHISAFWRRQVQLAPGADALFEYSYARFQVEQALRVAADSGNLTEVGQRLIAGLNDQVAEWREDAYSGIPMHAARLVADGHRAGWRVRHLVPAADAVDRLADAWSHGEDPPLLDPAYRVRPGPRRWSLGRLALARRWVQCGESTPTNRLRALGVDEADAALLSGDLPAASAAFARRIIENPADFDAWAGLGLAVGGPAGDVLRRHPALVRAVHGAVHDPAADPVALAAWLGRTWAY